jgi:hypothetical protein
MMHFGAFALSAFFYRVHNSSAIRKINSRFDAMRAKNAMPRIGKNGKIQVGIVLEGCMEIPELPKMLEFPVASGI